MEGSFIGTFDLNHIYSSLLQRKKETSLTIPVLPMKLPYVEFRLQLRTFGLFNSCEYASWLVSYINMNTVIGSRSSSLNFYDEPSCQPLLSSIRELQLFWFLIQQALCYETLVSIIWAGWESPSHLPRLSSLWPQAKDSEPRGGECSDRLDAHQWPSPLHARTTPPKSRQFVLVI